MSRRRAIELSVRDRQILGFVGEVGIASARQIERLAFPVHQEESALTAARRCRRTLARLTDHGFLSRLDRRIGGTRSGSSGYLYQLATNGKRALGISGRGRTWQPGGRFVEHALAAGELHVDLVAAEREGNIEDLTVTHEPATWRRFSAPHGLVTLKPDLLVELTTVEPDQTDGWELRWFVEIDRATEHLPTVLRKCGAYQQYRRSGREADHHEVFPRVLWSVPDEQRAAAIKSAIRRQRSLEPDLFLTALSADTVTVLSASPVSEEQR